MNKMESENKFRQYKKTGSISKSSPAYLKFIDGKLKLMFISENGTKTFDSLENRLSEYINKCISLKITVYDLIYNIDALQNKKDDSK